MTALRFGNYELNPQKQELLYHAPNGARLLRKMSFREASILRLLVEADGDIVENHILLDEFWGADNACKLNSLYVFMSRMKHMLSADPSLLIINVRGIGYRLIQS